MSSSLATAQQLKKVHLELGGSDINFLTPCLSSLSHSQSLQELFVGCDASGVFSWCAAHTCMHSHTHTHKHHMPEQTTPIKCPQGKYVHAVLTNRHHPHMLLCSCDHAPHTKHKRTRRHSHTNTIFLLHSFTAIPSTYMYMHNHMHMDTQTHTDRSTHVHTQNTCTASDCLDVAVI